MGLKYQLLARARPDDVTPDLRLSSLVDALAGASGPFSFDESIRETQVKFGSRELAVIPINKYAGKGVRGTVNIVFREGLEERAVDDDHFELRFDGLRVTVDDLVSMATLTVTSFNAYRTEIGPEDLGIRDFDAARLFDARHRVYRIYPVSYYDRKLCRSAFQLEPEDIASRVQSDVVSAEVWSDGLLIRFQHVVPTVEECESLLELTELLRN